MDIHDSAFSLDHNNRDFIPSNVDIHRIPNNFNPVTAGNTIPHDFPAYKNVQELWDAYHTLSTTYWNEYHLEQQELSAQIRNLKLKF